MISVSKLTLRFGERVLFDEVSVKFRPGYCYGLVGANGAGKSTFLKILAGEIAPTEGKIMVENGLKMGMLRQDQYAYDDYSVLDTVLMGREDLWKIQHEKTLLYAKASMTEEEGHRAAELEAEFGELNGYALEAGAGELLEGLGIETKKHDWQMKQLAGGWKLRVLLAQILYANPDILLLDEPTNHLDLKTIGWLEEYLNAYEGTILLVSHDRHFLNRICTHIADVDRKKVTVYTGNYDFFSMAAGQALDGKLSENARKEKRIAELKEFIARFSANASKSAQATSRSKLLDKIELEEIVPTSRQYPRVQFKMKAQSGKDVLECQGINKSFAEQVVLTDIGFMLSQGEKMAIIGSNGRGKTTLIKSLLSGVEAESAARIYSGVVKPDSGKIKWGSTVRLSVMPQDVKEESGFRPQEGESVPSALHWLKQFAPAEENQTLRGLLGRMLFTGEEQEKSIQVLSGGECQRMVIARMMLEGANTLVLDEPTNHMDLESIESLGKSLSEFPGTVIFTSHDQDLIARVATRILDLRPDGTFVDFKGTYAEYLDVLARESRDGKAKARV